MRVATIFTFCVEYLQKYITLVGFKFGGPPPEGAQPSAVDPEDVAVAVDEQQRRQGVEQLSKLVVRRHRRGERALELRALLIEQLVESDGGFGARGATVRARSGRVCEAGKRIVARNRFGSTQASTTAGGRPSSCGVARRLPQWMWKNHSAERGTQGISCSMSSRPPSAVRRTAVGAPGMTVGTSHRYPRS